VGKRRLFKIVFVYIICASARGSIGQKIIKGIYSSRLFYCVDVDVPRLDVDVPGLDVDVPGLDA
jgi:hypothetical protein